MKAYRCIKKTVMFSDEDYYRMGWLFEEDEDYRNERWQYEDYYEKTVVFPDGMMVRIGFHFDPYGGTDEQGFPCSQTPFVDMDFFEENNESGDYLFSEAEDALGEWETEINGTLYVVNLTDILFSFWMNNGKFYRS